MKKTMTILCLPWCLLLTFFIFWNSITYVTMDNEYTVVKQFGQIKTINSKPGLNCKLPFISTVNVIPKSKQFYDVPVSEIITSDKKTMTVDAFITWHVTDARIFTSSLNASTTTAEGRLDIIVYNAIKTVCSSLTQKELIISRDFPLEISQANVYLDDVEIHDLTEEDLEETKAEEDAEIVPISERLLQCIGNQCDEYGIMIDDIEIKVLDLPEENKDSVYQRMIIARNNIAAAYRAQGESEAQMIRNTTNKEITVMKSEAKAEADKTIAEGEAEYMKVLSDAYGTKARADFYLFSLSLDAAKESLENGNTTLFIGKDSPIAEIFDGTKK